MVGLKKRMDRYRGVSRIAGRKIKHSNAIHFSRIPLMMENMGFQIHAEDDLLLCCARTNLNSEKKEKIHSLLKGEVDWSYLIQTASRHGLIPLLYKNLKKTFPEMIPPDILGRIYKHFLGNAGRNIYLTEELLKLLDLFEKNGITALPFKGPALAKYAYGGLALREFSDLDILVQKQNISKAKDLLISRGYQWDSNLSRAQQEDYLQSDEGCCVLVHKDSRIMVELDREISFREFPIPLKLDQFWGRLGKIPLEKKMVPAFSPKDLLLMLCFHGSKHCWERLN